MLKDLGAAMAAVMIATPCVADVVFDIDVAIFPSLRDYFPNFSTYMNVDDMLLPGEAFTVTVNFSQPIKASKFEFSASINLDRTPPIQFKSSYILFDNSDSIITDFGGEYADNRVNGIGTVSASTVYKAYGINDPTRAVHISQVGVFLYAVPEPSTWAMTLIGIFGLGMAAAQRRLHRQFSVHDPLATPPDHW